MEPQRPLAFHPSSAPLLRSRLAECGVGRIAQVFSPYEIERLRVAVDTLLTNPPEAHNLTWRTETASGEPHVQRVSRANFFSAEITIAFLQATQLVTLGAWIFDVAPASVRVANGTEGSDGVVLVIKDPSNRSIHRDLRWHRDATFTQDLPINPFVNCGLYLDRSDERRGGLLVLPASAPSTYAEIEETVLEVPEQVCISAEPGDVVIHRSDVWHRSGPHQALGEVRRVLYANLYAR